jgi:uncharacterized membrane protein
MPYEWVERADTCAELHLWPYRSLRRKGMVGFVTLTAGLLALPLLVLIGSPVLWGLLPFVVGAVAAIWLALQRSYRDAEIVEVLRLTPDHVQLTRHGPRGRKQEWQANPHWVQVNMHNTGGPVPSYLTLRGAGREVELGAFLTQDERLTLERDLRSALRAS